MFPSLSIGTAQLSQKYGIYNYNNVLTIYDLEKILLKSNELGINSIDTAQSYGESEKIFIIDRFEFENSVDRGIQRALKNEGTFPGKDISMKIWAINLNKSKTTNTNNKNSNKDMK